MARMHMSYQEIELLAGVNDLEIRRLVQVLSVRFMRQTGTNPCLLVLRKDMADWIMGDFATNSHFAPGANFRGDLYNPPHQMYGMTIHCDPEAQHPIEVFDDQ